MARKIMVKSLITLVLGLSVYSLILLRIDADAFSQAITGRNFNKLANSPSSISHKIKSSQEVTIQHPESSENSVSAEDVLLIIRTSSSTIWRRLPIYLSTLFTSAPNIALYSDFPETIAGIPILDSYQNVSETLKASEDFKAYRYIHNFRRNHPSRYWEEASLEGDWLKENSDYWALDKYKFLPVLQNVYNTRWGFKWYVMIEDDTFMFWKSLLIHLGGLDHTEAHWLGHASFRLGQVFAHGGSGMVFSQAALERLFEGEENVAEKYETFTAEHHLGDYVLGHAFAAKNLTVNGDGRFTSNFGTDPPWMMKLNIENWNEKLFSVHHVHQRDISQLWELEKTYEASEKRFVTYGDLFEVMILPFIDTEKRSWDCQAQEQNSASTAEQPNLGDNAAFSKEGCRESCKKWENCLMWKWDESYGCFYDSGVALGKGVEDDDASHMSSGWMMSRIQDLRSRKSER